MDRTANPAAISSELVARDKYQAQAIKLFEQIRDGLESVERVKVAGLFSRFHGVNKVSAVP